MIPKKIFTIWLNDDPIIPELVRKCIESQKNLVGYEHRLITLENYWQGSEYVNQCIALKKWVKAADWLRMYYLFSEGGIFLDADMEVLKPFDDMLDTKMFVCMEHNKIFANSCVGSVAGHPLLGEYLRRVSENFQPSGDLIFEPGIRAFADLIWIVDREKAGIKVYDPEYFFPYNPDTKEVKTTDNTRCYHHFMKSWVPKT